MRPVGGSSGEPVSVGERDHCRRAERLAERPGLKHGDGGTATASGAGSQRDEGPRGSSGTRPRRGGWLAQRRSRKTNGSRQASAARPGGRCRGGSCIRGGWRLLRIVNCGRGSISRLPARRPCGLPRRRSWTLA